MLISTQIELVENERLTCFLRMSAWDSLNVSWAHLSALFVVFCCHMLIILYVSTEERGSVRHSDDLYIHLNPAGNHGPFKKGRHQRSFCY